MRNSAKGGARLQLQLQLATCMYAALQLIICQLYEYSYKVSKYLKLGGVEARQTYHFPSK